MMCTWDFNFFHQSTQDVICNHLVVTSVHIEKLLFMFGVPECTQNILRVLIKIFVHIVSHVHQGAQFCSSK